MLLVRNIIPISVLVIFAACIFPTHAAAQAPAVKQAPTAAQSPTSKMKDCLLIEDGYKERLDCYDAIIKPDPRAGRKAAKSVADCRYLIEEDERLRCYNGFVTPKQKAAAGKSPPKSSSTKPPSTTMMPPPK